MLIVVFEVKDKHGSI